MMEGLNQQGQEEYIWAMRTSAFRESDTDLWKERRASPITSESLLKKEKSTMATEDHQTKVLASLVPDEVIYNVNDYSHRHYDACFLFGDVSGFTELCEKYNKTGVSGPSRMTQVLNKYLGAMVQEIMSHNGDVLKFSGDAFLAIFKSSENETIRDAVHEAMDCALVIQKTYGQYETDVGVVIRVKLAISAGPVMFALIGDAKNSHYVVVGKPIWDVKAAEHISSAGDIIVSPAAWHYVNTNEYLFQEMDDMIHIKLLGVGPNWRSVQRNVRQARDQNRESDTLSQQDEDSSDSFQSVTSVQDTTNDEFALRPAVNVATRLKIKKDLRKFIIAPVMKSIDMDEPFEYLTEMRQAVIVFINVISRPLETQETLVLADQTYKIVCSVVHKMKGCVNKVSLFDKDLMFVVIFGLRGLKYELECQIALRCAKQCHDAINQLDGVISTSIGVTTGKTYCGVFGHTLRREYTVISLIVNKAARLMVAYKDKVTCDRETFLHSKMEARHFILQEPKPLKGISHPGPVYEFKELVERSIGGYEFSKFPLLGREDKIKYYQKLMEKYIFAPPNTTLHYKMLVIQGEARQGKTRLLDEFIYITPKQLHVNKLSLMIQDSRLPYQTLRLIFYPALGLTMESTAADREDKLMYMLRTIHIPDLLCVLNSVFACNFQNSALFLSFTQEEKQVALKQLIKQLCFACFTTKWVIAIDEAEFMDDESNFLLDTFFDIKNVFILATMSRDKMMMSSRSSELFKDARIKIMDLRCISRWYHGALACQILNVYAIPPELEKVIQARSNGNPGWIESFLISMIQDEGLYILKANLRQINDMGLVCPPLYQMTRMSYSETLEWKHIMEERRPSMDSLTEGDYWKRYIDSCRDSYLNVTVREQMEARPKGATLPVCILSPNFNVGDVEAELSIDVMILKTFDSLTSYEQLLIKCSAILGTQFPREMMLYVMSSSLPRQAALAVQKLFEIKVLCCARGDFLEGGTMLVRDRILDPNEDIGLKCECRGIKIDETCQDLPRYASCGYLQFRSSLFRDITYNLLTDNQKKEFHYRAIRYLEKETRRCRACGNGFFDRILGHKLQQDLISEKDLRRRRGGGSSSYDDGSVSRRLSVFSNATTVYSASGKKRSGAADIQSLQSSPSSINFERRGRRPYRGWFGFTMINKLKNSFSLTRGFSSEDFTDCQCNLILNTTYAQLVDHCRGAGDTTKMVDAMIEYSYICIIFCNIPLAMKIMDEALNILKRMAQEKIENSWKLSLIKAKVYTMIGYSRIELGQLEEAERNLHLSMAEYGIEFPKGVCRKKLVTCCFGFKQKFGIYLFPSSLIKRLDHWENVFANNLSECLSHLCTLYMAQEKWGDAELAATWSLARAMDACTDFQVICMAFANMIYVAQQHGRWNLCLALEVHALRLTHLKRVKVEAEELKCVAKLYTVIFRSRIYRANLDKAIHIGYIVLRICSSVHCVKILLPLLPLFIQCLLMGQHSSNAISILQELDYFADEDSDNSGKVWYFALCICFHLETGYAIVPYDICEKFFQIEGENWITIRDPDARKRYFTVMWLWCIRNERWEAAAMWCIKTTDFLVLSEADSIPNKFTALYLLEGLILYLVCKMDKKNIQAVMQAENEISHLMKAIEHSGRRASVIMARLYHLKAYFRFVKYNDEQVLRMLKKAQKYAVKNGNTLELAWMEHSVKAWNKTLPTLSIDFWKEHCEVDNQLDFRELELNAGKMAFFTLPTPMFV